MEFPMFFILRGIFFYKRKNYVEFSMFFSPRVFEIFRDVFGRDFISSFSSGGFNFHNVRYKTTKKVQ